MKRMTLLTGLVAAVAITAYSVSGTYARYTSTFTGTSSARVAKWAFNLDGGETAGTTLNFKLFESVNDENVTKGINENIIAPGTEGQFEIKLANLSEVTAKAVITLDGDLAGVPIEFSMDGEHWGDLSTITLTAEELAAGTFTEDETELPEGTDPEGEETVEEGDTTEDTTTATKTVTFNKGGEASLTVYWRWAFTGEGSDTFKDTQTDETDTALGLDGTATPTVTATIVATQVD